MVGGVGWILKLIDGEAWIQPPEYIWIVHKNRAQMLTRDRVCLKRGYQGWVKALSQGWILKLMDGEFFVSFSCWFFFTGFFLMFCMSPILLMQCKAPINQSLWTHWLLFTNIVYLFIYLLDLCERVEVVVQSINHCLLTLVYQYCLFIYLLDLRERVEVVVREAEGREAGQPSAHGAVRRRGQRPAQLRRGRCGTDTMVGALISRSNQCSTTGVIKHMSGQVEVFNVHIQRE